MCRHGRYPYPEYSHPHSGPYQFRGPMFFVVGIPYSIGRAAYKAYKKHQAEKDARERGIPHTVVDPSHEISPEILYDGVRNTSSHRRQPSVGFRLEHSGSSSSSITSQSSAAAQAEADLALEQDEEFRRFIQRQKHVYLSQHRALGKHSASSSATTPSVAELPASQPPAYDDVIAGDFSRVMEIAHKPSSSVPRTVQAPTDSENEIYLVSPSSVHGDSRVSEIDGSEISPVTPTRALHQIPAELPGSSRPAVELPAMAV